MCPRTNELHLAGEDCRESTKGMFLITTNSESPFASGQWTVQQTSKYPSNSRRDPFFERIDEYGKLDSPFNFINSYHKLYTPPHINYHPYDHLSNQINQNDYETTNNMNNVDKTRFDLDDDLKLGSTTEKWRQNDKFILVENPLATVLNRTISLHHTDSNDGFQFPKVTYR